MLLDRILYLIIGLAFLSGGGYIAKSSLDAKNMIESALFGLLGVGTGIFLIICALIGPPE